MTTARRMTLGGELERRRLELRVGRVERLLAELRLRAAGHARGFGTPPRWMAYAIPRFEREVRTMRARMEDLAGEVP